MKPLLRLFAALALVIPASGAAAPVAGLGRDLEAKIDRWLDERLRTSSSESFIVLFDASEELDRVVGRAARGADPRGAIYRELAARSRAAQAGVRGLLAARGIAYKPLWIVNGLQVTGNRGLVESLAARSEVVRIVGDPWVYGLSSWTGDPESINALEWGLLAVRADQVWNLDGVRGEGIVIASADTGVEWNHPAIRNKYRGWDGVAATHDYNWFDAIANLPAPLDDHNHGTHTVGTMVGDDGAGNQIGVAPNAKWIGCRNMNAGNGTPSTYIACNQYFLAPWPHGGDPELDGDPSKAPDIVNNSWECPPSEGCDVFVLRDSFKALQAAGILAVASAGNSGSSCNTVSSPPAIYDEAFVVGSTTSTKTLSSFSSRGVVTVDGSNRVRPDIAAPGSSVRSSVRGGAYATYSGTSMAGPHVAGATALLWSAKPQVKNLLGLSRCLLSRSSDPAVNLSFSQTCGGTPSTTRPNNMFGWGLVDAYAAIHLGPDADADGIANGCDCAPLDGGAYAIPGLAGGVAFAADKAAIDWTSLSREAGNGTLYDVVRGALADLHASGTIAGAACLGVPAATPFSSDSDLPGSGAGFYYVVQPRNVCGSGGFGAASAGTPRVHTSCP